MLEACAAGSSAHPQAKPLAELIYTCVANVVERCRKDGRDDLIEGMEHCLDPDDFNKRFYHATGEGSRSAARLSSEPTRLVRGGLLAWTSKHLAAWLNCKKLFAQRLRRGQVCPKPAPCGAKSAKISCLFVACPAHESGKPCIKPICTSQAGAFDTHIIYIVGSHQSADARAGQEASASADAQWLLHYIIEESCAIIELEERWKVDPKNERKEDSKRRETKRKTATRN